LTGHSLGGSGTWRLGASYSSKFSCIAPLSGSVNVNSASRYTSFPVWAFVGSADDIVSPNSSIEIVDKINNLGGNARVKIYYDATHFDVPDMAYKDQEIELLEWLIHQTNKS
jgi:predicted peptidase